MLEQFIDTIIKDDCTVFLSKLPTESVTLIVTDPPYFGMKDELFEKKFSTLEEYLCWYEIWIKEAYRVLKKNGSMYVFIPPLEFAEVHLLIKKYFCQRQVITWIKPNVMVRQPTARNYFPKTEFVGFYTKDEISLLGIV